MITNNHLSLFSSFLLSGCCLFSICPLFTLCWPLPFSWMVTKDRAGNSTISPIYIGLACQSYPSVYSYISASGCAVHEPLQTHTVYTNTWWAGGGHWPSTAGYTVAPLQVFYSIQFEAETQGCSQSLNSFFPCLNASCLTGGPAALNVLWIIHIRQTG